MDARRQAVSTQRPAVNVEEAVRAQAADDFGHLVHHLPAAVAQPWTADDVARTVRWAGQVGLRVAAQGRRHSVWGRCQAEGGVAVDMARLRSVRRARDDRVVVDAGATWGDVLA